MSRGGRSKRDALDCAQRRHFQELSSTQLALELGRQQDEQRRQTAQSWTETPVNPPPGAGRCADCSASPSAS
eukprot:170351-Pyramimonas_sp.AAC.1